METTDEKATAAARDAEETGSPASADTGNKGDKPWFKRL